MSFSVLSRRKTVAVLLALFKGAKGVRELQEATAGSYTTIQKRIAELIDAGLIEEELLTGEEYGKIPRSKRLLRLTEKGRSIVKSLLDAGFVKLPLLNKDRERWIVSTASVLGKIRGRTRFMKLLFLLRMEYRLRKGNFFRFKAWLYGPFSDDVAEDLLELEDRNLIHRGVVPFFKEEIREERILYEYKLTAEGERIAREILRNLSKREIEMLKELDKFNKMTLETLLRYIYRKYPEYITKSIITESIFAE